MEEIKKNRMAIAGFVLSLMGAISVFVSPLQLTALLLCLAAGGNTKYPKLRRMGILLSCIFLAVSLLLWTLFFCNADTVLTYFYESMKFYY